MTSPRDRSRWIGALAGLVPAGAVATLFAVSGSSAEPGAVAESLAWATGIAIVAGCIAGPLAAAQPRRLIKAAFAYAIAVIATLAALSIVQGIADVISIGGFDLGGFAFAIFGRILYTAASATYLLIPSVTLGFAWAVAARTVPHLGRSARRT